MPERQGWQSRALRAALWLVTMAAVTALLLPWRARLDKAHITLALLLVVLLAAADGGRRVGLLAAGVAFVLFNWFFLPPYGTLAVADPFDWFILIAFLATSVVASTLFHRIQRQAEDARARTREVAELSALGAEAMRAPRAEAALRAVAEALQRVLHVDLCRVHLVAENAGAPVATVGGERGVLPRDVTEQVQVALERGTGMATLESGVVRTFGLGEGELRRALGDDQARRLLLPLLARGRVIGVLEIDDAKGLPLDEPRERLLAALSYYAALGADRLRLERASEHLEALREADKLKNAVLASVSHDLRTPLTTIKALAHGLGSLGDERSEIIEQEADRLNRFVADLLDVSRLTSGRFPLTPTIGPVEELVAAALQQVEGILGDRRVDVRLGNDDPLLLARFDATHSVRILVNLLENAGKYASSVSSIELRAVRDGSWVRLSVADRGPGVPPNESERIFEALYRPDGARPDLGSAGLGLAIARGLAEAQGATLTYASRDGGGSVFTLSLPAADLADLNGAPES